MESKAFAMLSLICKFFPGQQWAFAGMTSGGKCLAASVKFGALP